MRSSDAERAVADLAAYQYGVISRSQAASMGMSASVLRRRVAKGVLKRATPTVFVTTAAPPSWHQDAMVAVLAHDGSVLSHRAAARLHQLDGFRDAPVELSIVTRGRHSVGDVQVHHVRELGGITERMGIPVTAIPRTLCDLGSVVDLDRVEQALDGWSKVFAFLAKHLGR